MASRLRERRSRGRRRSLASLDILGLAQHQTGDTAAAVETQRRALSLMPEGMNPDLPKHLAEYEAALAGSDRETVGEAPAEDAENGESGKAPPATEATDKDPDDAGKQ